MRTYENKNTKIYSEGLTGIYTKMCTFQNFPLYSTCTVDRSTAGMDTFAAEILHRRMMQSIINIICVVNFSGGQCTHVPMCWNVKNSIIHVLECKEFNNPCAGM